MYGQDAPIEEIKGVPEALPADKAENLEAAAAKNRFFSSLDGGELEDNL